ncbi:MAG: hypothetical protein HUU01_01730 [Saprospiraceae bacterium]|nr:hypothetical protein [Saprospiraceae bacterium]
MPYFDFILKMTNVPESTLAKIGTSTPGTNSESISFQRIQSAIDVFINRWHKIANSEGKRLVARRILPAVGGIPFETFVHEAFKQELSNLSRLISGAQSALQTEIAHLSGELDRWKNGLEQRQRQLEESRKWMEEELETIRKSWEGLKLRLLEKIDEYQTTLVLKTKIRENFANQFKLNPGIYPFKSWLKKAAFALIFILIVLVELPLNAGAFQIFRHNLIETYLIVFGFAVTVPLLAHFTGEVALKLKLRFSWWDCGLLLFCLGLPIALSIVIGIIRADFLQLLAKESGKDHSFASWIMLSFFNIFMFISAVLVSYFLSERSEEKEIRRLFLKEEAIGKLIAQLKEEIATNEKKYIEECSVLKKNHTAEIAKSGEQEKVLRDAIADKVALFNSVSEEYAAFQQILINGKKSIIQHFRTAAFRRRRRNDPPMEWQNIPEFTMHPAPTIAALDLYTILDKPGSMSRTSSNGLAKHASSLINVMMFGLFLLLFTSCSGRFSFAPEQDKVELPIQVFVAFDGTDGENSPPSKIDITRLTPIIPTGTSCTIEAGILNNSSDIFLNREELPQFGVWHNPIEVREARSNFLKNTEKMLDSLHRVASKVSNNTSEIYIPIMKKLHKMASEKPSSRNIVIIASDMLENSAIQNMYTERHPDLLEANFLTAVTPPDLRNFEIHFLPPKKMKESDRKFSREFWESFFTKLGAKVSWSLNLDLTPSPLESNLSYNSKK